jgi:hypothetical protein
MRRSSKSSAARQRFERTQDLPAVQDTTEGSGKDQDLSPDRRRLPSWLRAGAPLWVWLGVAIAGAGFVLLAVAWGQVAAETQVHLQLPYVVSAGMVGLCFVMIGLAVVNIATRDRDAINRDSQIDRLVSILEELKHELAQRREGKR